jgi:hypothetical protein
MRFSPLQVCLAGGVPPWLMGDFVGELLKFLTKSPESRPSLELSAYRYASINNTP